MIHLSRACRGRTAVRFPANSSHKCFVELALDGLLSTLLNSKGGFKTRGFSFINPTALTRWWAPLRVKQLSVAATALMIWLCACVRYWPGCAPWFKFALFSMQLNKFNLFFIDYCISRHFSTNSTLRGYR